jgi:hypothetical protein
MILRDAPADQLWRNVDPLTNPPCPPTAAADFYDLLADPGHEPGDVYAQIEEGPGGSAPPW